MPLAIRGLVQLCETLSFGNTNHSNVNAKTKSKWLQLLMPLNNGFLYQFHAMHFADTEWAAKDK